MKKNILLCVTGGIASYKAPNVVSQFLQKEYNVNVIMSKHATQFISPIVFDSLTSKKTLIDLFEDPLAHIKLGKEADVILVLPTTYNLVGKVANGIADDLITSVISAYDKDVFFALAMNDNMYKNPIMLKNRDYLKSLGKYHFIEADKGFLACNKKAIGRLKPELEITEVIINHLKQNNYPKILQGKKVVITAGRTKEYIDPIRYISNDSTGLMGYNLAKVARKLGATVSLIIGENNLDKIYNIKTIDVISAQDMYQETLKETLDADIIIFSAAVSDYKFSTVSPQKIKKTNNTKTVTIKMEENIDIAKAISQNKNNQITVGFALETDDLIENAKKKIKSKNLDFIIANSPQNLGSQNGLFYLLSKNKYSIELNGSKEKISLEIFNNIIK